MAMELHTDLDWMIDRLETMRKDGFFHQPRSLSELFCRLEDAGTTVELGILASALSEMWEHDELLRTVLSDGLLRYADISEAGHLPSIDGNDPHLKRQPLNAGRRVLH